MNDLTTTDMFTAAIAFAGNINALGSLALEAESRGWREQARVAGEIESVLAGQAGALDGLATVRRAATSTETATHLAMLLKAFPNAGKDDAAIFGEMLVGDVIDLKPSIAAAVLGCTKIRRTSKFLPTIAEVLEAIGEVDSQFRAAESRLSILPDKLARLKSLAAEGERWERIKQEREGKAGGDDA